MMAFTADGQLNPALLEARDRRLGATPSPCEFAIKVAQLVLLALVRLTSSGTRIACLHLPAFIHEIIMLLSKDDVLLTPAPAL